MPPSRAADPATVLACESVPVLLALLHELGVTGAESHDRALGDKGIDDGAADALGTAGDQNAFALETEVHVSSDAAARL